MAFESTDLQNQSKIEAKSAVAERRKVLHENLGLTLCARQKEGGIAPLAEQIVFAESLNLPSVQFDLRARTIEEIEEVTSALMAYRALRPEVNISLHGENLRPEIETLDFSNTAKERARKELALAHALQVESYTVHPPAVSVERFTAATQEARDAVVAHYVALFADLLPNDTAAPFSIAIENMNTEGAEGSWGQNFEDINYLINSVSVALIEKGVDPTVAENAVGATLDINHALHGAKPEEYLAVLEGWCKGLGNRLKVVHVYTPSATDVSLLAKYKLALDLVAQYNPCARIFMETKQNDDVTARVYGSVKGEV